MEDAYAPVGLRRVGDLSRIFGIKAAALQQVKVLANSLPVLPLIQPRQVIRRMDVQVAALSSWLRR